MSIQSWWKATWAKIQSWFDGKHSEETASKPQSTPVVEPPQPEPLPVPEPEPVEPTAPLLVPSTDKQIARSWENGAAWREHNELADGVTYESFVRHVSEKKRHGCNTINLYLMNMKDGAPVPTSFYLDGDFGGAVDNERVARMKEKIAYAYSAGMQINFWMLPDDGGYPVTDYKLIKQYFVDCKTHFGPETERASYIVVCLESNEVLGTYSRLNLYAAELQALFGKKIANHMTSGKVDWSNKSEYVSVHFHQVNPRKSVSDCEQELKNIVAVCTKPVLACEISLHGKSDEAREKARRALAAGCIGVHSGVPKE